MNAGRLAPRVAIVVSALTVVTAVIGFVVASLMHAFVFDRYNAYGEVPIPGSGTVQLPAGEVTISFHTQVTDGGAGLPIPLISMTMVPPTGAADPAVTQNIGGTTTVNNDARVRLWVAQIPEAGIYRITTEGPVNGYISPRLAFGHGSQYGWVVWLFVGLFVLGMAELVASLVWAIAGKRSMPGPDPVAFDTPTWSAGENPIPSSYTPTDHGVRIEQLKTLTRLRDSGALTEEEFEAEKRRVLDS